MSKRLLMLCFIFVFCWGHSFAKPVLLSLPESPISASQGQSNDDKDEDRDDDKDEDRDDDKDEDRDDDKDGSDQKDEDRDDDEDKDDKKDESDQKDDSDDKEDDRDDKKDESDQKDEDDSDDKKDDEDKDDFDSKDEDKPEDKEDDKSDQQDEDKDESDREDEDKDDPDSKDDGKKDDKQNESDEEDDDEKDDHSDRDGNDTENSEDENEKDDDRHYYVGNVSSNDGRSVYVGGSKLKGESRWLEVLKPGSWFEAYGYWQDDDFVATEISILSDTNWSFYRGPAAALGQDLPFQGKTIEVWTENNQLDNIQESTNNENRVWLLAYYNGSQLLSMPKNLPAPPNSLDKGWVELKGYFNGQEIIWEQANSFP